MKTSELRIGNWIFEDEGTLCKIIGLKPFPDSIRCDEEEGCNILIDIYPHDGSIKVGYIVESFLCKPIPLTEEWKLKFGFEKTEWDNFNSFRLSIGNNDYTIVLYTDGNCEVGDIITCKIEYVHQLQNLYFALTGEELKQ
jgi:hypothetical protein